MSQGLLCLKWNNHSSAFNKLLNDLHKSIDCSSTTSTTQILYSDATLVCNGKFYSVHQFVLSTCSDYFKSIFEQSLLNKCKHPFVVIGDVSETQVELLLNYMYKGIIQVPQEQLPSLIKAAEIFKVKGLAIPEDDDNCPPNSVDKKRNNSTTNSISPKRLKNYDYNNDGSLNSFSAILNSDSKSSNIEKKSFFSTILSPTKEEISEDPTLNFTNNAHIKSEPLDDSNYLDDITETETSQGKRLTKAEELEAFNNPFYSNSNDSNDQVLNWNAAQNIIIRKEEDEDSEKTPSEKATSHSSNEEPSGSLSSSSTSFTNSLNITASDIQNRLFASSLLFQASKFGGNKEKPFSCVVCQYRFLTKHELKVHMRKHTGEKPYTCQYCTYRSSQSANLQTHLKIHTGEKPFICNYCPYRATQKVSLMSHMKRHMRPNMNMNPL